MQIYEFFFRFTIRDANDETRRRDEQREKKMIGHRKVRCRSSFQTELGPSYMDGLDYLSPRVLPAASLFFNDRFSFFRSRIISFFESMSSRRSETMSFCSSS